MGCVVIFGLILCLTRRRSDEGGGRGFCLVFVVFGLVDAAATDKLRRRQGLIVAAVAEAELSSGGLGFLWGS